MSGRWAQSVVVLALAVMLGGCSSLGLSSYNFAPMPAPAATAEAVALPVAPSGIEGLIGKYSARYNVPEPLVRRVIAKESGFNPKARNGRYWGLMQISYDTARAMGYRGPAEGLLDPDTNLRYGVSYLSGAYRVADGNADRAMRYYARGYYYDAKRRGMLGRLGY